MPELIIGLGLIVLLFVFAFYGFIKFITLLVGEPSTPPELPTESPNNRTERDISDDILGTSHLLNHLFREKRISKAAYDRLRNFIEREYLDKYTLSQRISENLEPEVADELARLADETRQDVKDDALPVAKAEVVGSALAAVSNVSVVKEADVADLASRPGPWDLPDPPATAPRRTFGEVMAGFMLEKNIRWGELASGILIVGSAVGLVVSLRNELRDTIPYFSALLFMLITAAIHGAGIYTLKKWKLRNTSRGTLIIGLLLIPLNLIAACILSGNESDRREFSDPLLWLALGIGLSTFSAMCWFSTKCLLRKGQLPLVVAIMGCCISILLVNRADFAADSSLSKLLLSVPIILSFLAGTTCFYRRQWLRVRWPERTSFRAFLVLGLTSFAAIVAASMLVIKFGDKAAALVSLAPLATVICLMTAWIGRIVWLGGAGIEKNTLRLTGLTLCILGLSMMALSLFFSAANPTMLLVNSCLATCGLLAFAKHQNESRLLPFAWAAFGLLAICAANLSLGKLDWNTWATLSQLGNAVLSGQSGLTLLAVGGSVIGLHALLARRAAANTRFLSLGIMSGSAIAMIGCLLALIASFANPSNQFDMHTATTLLGIAAVASLLTCVYYSGISDTKQNSADQSSVELANDSLAPSQWRFIDVAAACLLFGFMAHGLIWNQFLATRMDSWLYSVGANWNLVFVAHSLCLALVAWAARRHHDRATAKCGQPIPSALAQRSEIADSLGEVSLWGGVLGAASLFGLLQQQTGLATVLAAGLAFAFMVLAGVQSKHRFGIQVWTGLFTAASLFTVIVGITELATKTQWCTNVDEVRFWLVLLTAIATWAVFAMATSWAVGRLRPLRKFATFQPRVESVTVQALTLGTLIFFSIALAESSRLELFVNARPELYSLNHEWTWGFVVLGTLSLTVILANFVRPTFLNGVALVISWLLAWAFGAEYFGDAKAVGTAIRWILPVGGAIGAVLVASRKPFRPIWAAVRNQFGLSGKSTWPGPTTQHLINFALASVAFIVLLISTIAITQVMMNGGVEALGGPLKSTLFGDMKKDVSYGLPVAIMVGTFLLYAISERRKWLATAGSAVFQYCVILSVVLLFVSPHPKLASSWFVNILQAVSVGMTGYGFVWYYFRNRIEGIGNKPAPALVDSRLAQIETHTLINGLLISSLAVLVMARFYTQPTISGDWISTVGSLLGIGAWAMYGGLAYTVLKLRLNQPHRTSTWMWLACWLGMALVSMIAAFVDRQMAINENTIPWRTFGILMWGAIGVCVSQVVLLALEKRPEWVPGVYAGTSSLRFKSLRSDQTVPLLFAGAVVSAFAIRGIVYHPGGYWLYVAALLILIGCLVAAGLMRQSPWLAFISAGLTATTSLVFVSHNPYSWFGNGQPHALNLLAISLLVLAAIWSGYFIWQTIGRVQERRRAMVYMSNSVLLIASLWTLLAALVQCAMDISPSVNSTLKNPKGLLVLAGTTSLCILHLWSQCRRGWLTSIWLVGLAILVFLSSFVRFEDGELQVAMLALTTGFVPVLAGLAWAKRKSWIIAGERLGMPALPRLEESMRYQLPIYFVLLGLIIFCVQMGFTFGATNRAARYLLGFSPFAVGAGFVWLSKGRSGRGIQWLALATLTLAAVTFAWADLNPTSIRAYPAKLFIRALVVLAGAMFFYGGFVSRWVREGDSWLTSLREMTVATSSLALVCFIIVIVEQIWTFVPDVGCDTSLAEAIAVAVAGIGMMVGLVMIAVVPKNDPFAFSMSGRMGYVYVAQIVGALVVVHLYLTMPFLFQLGIKDYWPYIAMVLCFGGVGVAHVLEKRNLTVLGQPLFNTAAILPILVAMCIWAIDSKADSALVMLTIGMAYLLISYTHQSLLSGAAAILFGNFSLWLFYDKFDGFSFLDHPQLWLIPPALSVLTASQIARNSLKRNQLALVRYICVTVIYVSSTSEIFINGLGEELWPPMVLAVLAIGGIMAGIMFQIRAYLYLGSLFLLMAMISMVSHAHQRLEHVWPWWAFGIGMGVAILVMFGLFEKRKNDMRQVVRQLSKWDL